MRFLSAAALAALAVTAALPAAAQEDPNLPGVNVTIQRRSYLDPGVQVPPRTLADYRASPLNRTFTSPNYSGIEGFQRHPLPYETYLPDNGGAQYVLRAPDRER